MRKIASVSAAAALIAAGALFYPSVSSAEAIEAVLYKNPQCGCCEDHAEYLEENGFSVEVVETHDLPLIKQEHEVPVDLAGCHTILVDDYVVEGHVTAETIKRLLDEEPDVAGISLPGMPLGSPGMSGPKQAPLEVFTFGGGDSRLYATE
ncbi:DUF411 domain-containing protein [Caenispirillum salinarum]|uniref:DUF411 domain-containing protein n=1 Tax=Caenispirillum salinarum TaxID=859058 RepID=UPI00384B2486